NRMEFIYVKSQQAYADIAKLAGWTFEPNGYNVGFMWDNDHGKFVLHTPREPNVGAQLYTLCGQALFCNLEGTRDFPWLYEGLCLYYESAQRLNAAGNLDVRQLLPDYQQTFRASDRKGELVPLERLLTMRDKEFDADSTLGLRAQALLLMHYLM